jgi:hypothetical protein
VSNEVAHPTFLPIPIEESKQPILSPLVSPVDSAIEVAYTVALLLLFAAMMRFMFKTGITRLREFTFSNTKIKEDGWIHDNQSAQGQSH